MFPVNPARLVGGNFDYRRIPPTRINDTRYTTRSSLPPRGGHGTYFQGEELVSPQTIRMSVITTTSWLGVRLYYARPYELLLTQALLPYANTVLQTGVADSFYFQRGQTDGPHIQLCFRGSPEYIDTLLCDNAQEHFSNFMETMPSIRAEPSTLEHPIDTRHRQPNNSVLCEKITPPVTAHGGSFAHYLSEKMYQCGSLATLNLLRQSLQLDNWTHDEAGSNAIQFHLYFLHAVGYDPAQSADFLRELLHERQAERGFHHQRTFRRALHIQQHHLFDYVRAVWARLDAQAVSEEDPLFEWYHAARTVGRALHSGAEQHFFELSKTQIRGLYRRYLTTINNCLGIQNQDEHYLLFTLSETLAGKKVVRQPTYDSSPAKDKYFF